MSITIPGSLSWLTRPSTGYDLFSRPPTKPTGYPSLATTSDGDAAAAPMRIIASRGTEIFVGKGNEVRCADLRDLKARHLPKASAQEEMGGYKEYKMLDLPHLNFEIHQLEVSNDGLLLAIVGEKEVAVCILPAEGLARMESSKLRVPAFNMVGTNHHNVEKGSRIVRVLWHPLGVEGASLVVLTSDSMIRTYAFTIGQDSTFEIPDQTLDLYSLSGRKRHAGGFFADQEEMEAASCCFGGGFQGWRPFTLYILMRGGDIYALSPLVPSRWKASPEYLQNLSLSIAADVESLGETASVEDKLVVRQQSKWIHDVMSQESDLQVAAYSGSGISPRKKPSTSFRRAEVAGVYPQLQGPFLFQPAPLELSNEEYHACDIFHIESGLVGVIGVLFSDGKLDLCLEFDPLRAKWARGRAPQLRVTSDSEEPIRGLPVIAGYETIDLDIRTGGGSSLNSWPVFSRDPRSNEVWYVNHNSGLVGFSMKAWLSKMATVLDGDEEGGFIALSLAKNPQSVVYRIIDNGKRPQGLVRPVIGSLAVYEAYLGYLLIAVTTTSAQGVEFDDVPGRSGDGLVATRPRALIMAAPSQHPSPFQKAISPQPTESSPPRIRRMSILSPQFVTPPELSRPSPLKLLLQQEVSRNRALMTSEVALSTEANAILRRARDTLKSEYDCLMEAAQEMYDRAATQRIEFHKQLDSIRRVSERLDQLRNRDVRARLERFVERQEELHRRADEVLRLLVIKNAMGLSDAEKKWFREVSKIEERINGEDRASLESRKAIVESMAQELCPMADENGDTTGRRRITTLMQRDAVPEEVRAGKLRQLKELLDREDALVNATKKKLENLTIESERL